MNPLLRWLTSPEWTHVVGALLHSLWQGAILAIALAVLMRRLTNPVTRYRCALGTLGVLVTASIITWAVLNAPKPAAPIASPNPAVESELASTPTTALNLDSPDKAVVVGKMSPPTAPTNWTAWLALVWMVGTIAMLLRAGIKVAGAENLRRSCKPLDNESMMTLVAEACRAVALARKIRVAVTDKLTSPAVVGVIVPTLILPLSLFSALTPEQIRFILLHELAHIRRGDYLANLFQLFAEALLFFNPAVWWISHQIRREREASCDALAIELSGAPADYARTLVRVAENILQPAPTAAVAFGEDSREPSPLADRVQRLLVPGYRPSLRLTWRAILTSLIVGGTLLVLSAIGTRNTVGAILTSNQPTSPVLQGPGINPDVQPTVSGDDSNIQTTLIPTLTEFVGYDLATAATFVPTPLTGTSQSINSVLPLPIFRVRQITTNNKVPFLGDVPLVGKFFNSESSAARQMWHQGEDSFRTHNWTRSASRLMNGSYSGNELILNSKSNLVSGAKHKVTLPNHTISSAAQVSAALPREIEFEAFPRSTFVYRIGKSASAIVGYAKTNQSAGNRSGNANTPITAAPTNTTPAEPLYTRTFEVDLNLFYAAVRKSAGLSEPVTQTNVGHAIRPFFANAGVNLDPALGKSFFISTSRGDMWVRATLPELDAIETLLLPIAGTPLTRRSYHFDSDTLAKVMAVLSREIRSIVATNPAAGFRALLESFNPDDPRPKQVRYLAEREEIYARATEADFERFESALKGALRAKPADTRIESTSAKATNLFTRTFLVEPGNIMQAIETMSPQFKPVTVTNLMDGLRALLQSSGADLSPPKSIFYNDRAGGLFVRATTEDLDAIESLLQVIGQQPLQVNIKAMFVEVSSDKNILMDIAKVLGSAARTGAEPLGTNFTGILTDPQFRVILRALERSPQTKILSTPQVTTLSGRQAQIQAADMKTIINGITAVITNGGTNFVYQSQAMPFGPVLDILPTVSNDGYTIQMTLTPTVTEFLGYEDAKKLKIWLPDDKATLPLPVYRTRQMTTSAIVWDGQTIVLGNFSDQIMTAKPDGKNESKPSDKQSKQLLVFITPTIIDQAGNRANTDMGLPSKLVLPQLQPLRW